MTQDSGGPLPDGWSGLGAIAAFQRLNTKCMAMLAEVAREETMAAECGLFRELDLWKQVDQRACERAGHCPVLLVNMNFWNLVWWKGVCAGAAAAPPPMGGFILREEQGRALLREILMSVWRLGDAAPREATLLFGMTPGVSAEIARVQAAEIDRIAVEYAIHLRPRWEENGSFWKRLLEAALGADDEELAMVQLHCLQLLGSDVDLRYN